MDLGFETVGNATLIVHDSGPLLVTDPWLGGPAFFGSWCLSHEIPTEQTASALEAKFVWFSHGHPDHLNGAWLDACRGRKVLLPDHVGGRIKADLERAGLDVEVLPHARWVPLSDRVRVWCFADVHQDAILLVDLDGRAIVANLNDATQTGWGAAVKREIRRFSRSYLLQLSGWGDANMINFVNEDGTRIPPLPRLRRERGYKVGDALAKTADGLGVTHVIPFSSTHRYQREDSDWANEFAVHDDDYADGFASRQAELLPVFASVDVLADSVVPLSPVRRPHDIRTAKEFGDDWSEELSQAEANQLRQYVQRVEHFEDSLRFIKFRVGAKETTVDLGGRKTDRGITFHVPRASLLAAMSYEIFDDLLAGNFMETTLHGKWPAGGLGSHFGPYLTRFGDNGRAHSRDDVAAYLATYRSRVATVDKVRNAFEAGGARLIRSTFEVDSWPYRVARSGYWRAKRILR